MPINILFNFPSWYTAVTPRTVTPKDAPNCNKSGITDTNQYMNVLLLSLFPFFAVIFWCLTAIISWTLMPKYWIGNERKRRGLTSKRGPREPTNNTLKYVPGQKRKKSSYSASKARFSLVKKVSVLFIVWNILYWNSDWFYVFLIEAPFALSREPS